MLYGFVAEKEKYNGVDGYYVTQYHAGKAVVEQFVSRNEYRPFCQLMEIQPHIKVKKAYKPLTVDEMREAGYPFRICGNDNYKATLVHMQPLLDGDWMGVYRYPGGDCVHDLDEIMLHFGILEW